ncbi:MAG: 3-hydroxyacyl-CoA dehydrogenase NAD-binding domain-containing protein [Pseudomonadota bacterium]
MPVSAWSLTLDPQGIVWLTLDVPERSANTLSSGVLSELAVHIGTIASEPPRGLVIRSGKRSGFIAGADINEFTQLRTEAEALTMVRRGQQLCDRIAALPFPTVALLQGFALGGGLELALACRYRVGIDDDRLTLGLPEVQLGIHPGFGGTVRSVQLLGVRPAMDLMLTGKTLRADKALAVGLIDRLVPPTEAEATCVALITQRPAPHKPPLTERLLSLPGVRALLAPALLRRVAQRARREHYPAPYAIVELWARHGARGEAALDAEARSISALFLTSTARNLVRVFQLQDRLKALGAKDAAAVAAGKALQRVHVVGAGTMGGDIAAWCALRGFEVTLQDRSAEQIAPALQRAAELFDKRVHAAAERSAVGARLAADVAGAGVGAADFVIEAIFENLEVKQGLFAQLEPAMKADAVLATNTSSLMLESLSSTLARPGRLVGLHFFNPVAQMPLVEVIHAADTQSDALALAVAFTRRIDKLPLPCRSSPGFLVNRVLAPYLQEAMVALEQGIAAELIDAAATRFGMPMGPLELADVVGLDVCKKVGEIVGGALARSPPVPLTRIETLVAAKKLGKKTGEGFYVWRDGKPVRQQADVNTIPADLQDRLILSLVNESVACLREQLVGDADLVDAGVVFGAGFAPFRGGPLAWAKETGAGGTVERLRALAAVHGARFTPDPGWALLSL